jgi:HEAT repeat protein
MRRKKETTLDWRRFGRAGCAVIAMALLSPLLAGCNPRLDNDSDVQALEASWPAYRAPTLDASAKLNIWPGGAADVSSPSGQQRGRLPELDRAMPVIRSYREWSLEETAVDSLARIGRPAVPELIKALRNNEPKLRYQAAQVLGRIGPEAEVAVPALVRAMEDPEPGVQKAAARALGQIGTEAGDAVRALMDLIGTVKDRQPAISVPAQ